MKPQLPRIHPLSWSDDHIEPSLVNGAEQVGYYHIALLISYEFRSTEVRYDQTKGAAS